MPEQVDSELQAIQHVISSLESLDAQARGRVLDYVFKRLGLSGPMAQQLLSSEGRVPSESRVQPAGPEAAQRTAVKDIRGLKEEKSPRSANQMAALVAYYLAELAPAKERKDTIGKDDIAKYFTQAGFPPPKQPAFTLTNAKNAGYLDQAGERGLYKLNPVGYNLVVHGLPGKESPEPRRRRRSAKKGRSRTAAVPVAGRRSRTRNRG